MSCTTILVGKKASYDGSTLVARNDDSGSGSFMPKKFTVVTPDKQPKVYRSVISHVEIELPESPLRYTSLPNAVDGEGIWAACGVNELNVSMTATETIASNERVLGADPLVVYSPAKGRKGSSNYSPEKIGGIGEEDIVTIVLPYIKSAREGVIRLGGLLEKYGTYEMNAIAFQDEDEIWWLESIGGHHWMARRVPDDCYVVAPNQLGLDSFDFEDAFGNKKDHLCSSDLREFIEENHLDLSLCRAFNPRDTFGTHSDLDHIYNTPRAWVAQKYFNPTTSKWTGDDADYTPLSDNLPWCSVPEKKITVEDIKWVLSNHYQHTPYDPYTNGAKELYRPIGISRTDVLALVQIRPYMPDVLKAVKWIAFGSNVFNSFVGLYANITKTPKYLANTTGNVDSHNFYWASRLLGVIADAHFNRCLPNIDHYQTAVLSKNHELINKFDKEFAAYIKGIKKDKKAAETAYCEKANEEIAKMLEAETTKALNKVVFSASCQMKNSFSRSDA